MFCPKCGAENNAGLNFCRSCGLKLDKVVEAVSEQLPANVDKELERRSRDHKRAGCRSLLIAGVAGLIGLVFLLIQSRNLDDWFFPVFVIAIVAWAFFLLIPALRKRFSTPEQLPRTGVQEQSDLQSPAPATTRLIDNRPFERVPSSVTENTTELLEVPRERGRSD